jgi:predicted HAD superfamily Cof-like phosphohydrolase
MNREVLSTKFAERLDGVLADHGVSPTLIKDIFEVFDTTLFTTTHQVAEFHRTFGHPINHSPVNDPVLGNARVRLIREELNELEKACKEGDIVEQLDALCDLEYVVKGSVLALGFPHIFNEAFDAVHESNMTKLCNSVEEAERTIEFTKTKEQYKDDVITYIPAPNHPGKFVVVTDKGKVVKSIGYKPVNLQVIVDEGELKRIKF